MTPYMSRLIAICSGWGRVILGDWSTAFKRIRFWNFTVFLGEKRGGNYARKNFYNLLFLRDSRSERRLRAYPKNPVVLNVIHAHPK
ncbi:MAG TPA: hypothetical protein VGK06_11695 [Methanosarcina sp.]